jgi:tetratricopeptide (TPR) repeat protein
MAGAILMILQFFQIIAKGKLLIRLKRYQEALATYGEALAAFDKALVSRPDDFFLHFFRADVLIHLDRYDEANATYDRAQHLAPHPLVAVQCIFAGGLVRTQAEAKARLQAADKEISEKAIADEIELMHEEKKLEPLRTSIFFMPICRLMPSRRGIVRLVSMLRS